MADVTSLYTVNSVDKVSMAGWRPSPRTQSTWRETKGWLIAGYWSVVWRMQTKPGHSSQTRTPAEEQRNQGQSVWIFCWQQLCLGCHNIWLLNLSSIPHPGRPRQLRQHLSHFVQFCNRMHYTTADMKYICVHCFTYQLCHSFWISGCVKFFGLTFILCLQFHLYFIVFQLCNTVAH